MDMPSQFDSFLTLGDEGMALLLGTKLGIDVGDADGFMKDVLWQKWDVHCERKEKIYDNGV